MAARKAKKPRVPRSEPAVSHSSVRVIRGFYHQPGDDGLFGFDRFYWLPGEGVRESIQARFLKKRRPAGAESEVDTAAKVEVLLPPDAPEIFADVEFLVQHYEQKLAADETTAYAQVTMRFPEAPSLHHPYEVARAWVREFFTDRSEGGVPVVLVLHAPHLAGSGSPVHIHALVLPVRLGRFGWSKSLKDLTSDEGQQAALASWMARKDQSARSG